MNATRGSSNYQDFLQAILSDRERFFAEVVDDVAQLADTATDSSGPRR